MEVTMIRLAHPVLQCGDLRTNDSINKALSGQEVQIAARYHFSMLTAAALTEASLPEPHIGEALTAIPQTYLLPAPLKRKRSKLQPAHESSRDVACGSERMQPDSPTQILTFPVPAKCRP
jgi:hypothetical protein